VNFRSGTKALVIICAKQGIIGCQVRNKYEDRGKEIKPSSTSLKAEEGQLGAINRRLTNLSFLKDQDISFTENSIGRVISHFADIIFGIRPDAPDSDGMLIKLFISKGIILGKGVFGNLFKIGNRGR
jgi:hypothetical protein